ncbi:hypothetical protein C7271_07770 [filamentous cyanobacterium CCP5]|nr:hypothetical protein C7271_07770 [filamentous cyanobacterium CCP5]
MGWKHSTGIACRRLFSILPRCCRQLPPPQTMTTPPTSCIIPEPSPLAEANPLILVVDDVAANLRILRSLLGQTNYRLSFASSGQQALERAQAAHPDLILLDLMMPGMDGLEVCKRLKQDAQTADIPIIFLTASQEIEHVVDAFQEGAVDYVTKPFRAQELLVRIKTHLDLTQLRQRAQRRAVQEEILRQVVVGIHGSLDLKEILNQAIAGIHVLLQADRVLICQHLSGDKPPGAQWQMVTSSSGEFPPEIKFAATLTTQHLSVDDSEFLDPDDALWLQETQTAAELRSPIFMGQDFWGTLLIQYQRPRCWGGEAALARPIVAQLEIAIHQAQLYRQLADTVGQLETVNHELTRLSNLDGLTQIGNRRFFDTQFQQEWARSLREKQPLTVILADVDYFKNYNDTYGHLEGDRCLKIIAHVLGKAPRRTTDVVARYGGEEFVMVLANTDETGAEHVALRVQELLHQLNLPHISHQSSPCVTISLGIATAIPTQSMHPMDLIDRADKALYQAKADGRNRYKIAPRSDLDGATAQEN